MYPDLGDLDPEALQTSHRIMGEDLKNFRWVLLPYQTWQKPNEARKKEASAVE